MGARQSLNSLVDHIDKMEQVAQKHGSVTEEKDEAETLQFSDTPLDKLKANLSRAKEIDDKRKKVVFLCTGSYNPVHFMHVNSFELAKKHIEEEGHFCVLAAFLSPSHDEYVSSKLGDHWISAVHRVKMIELATEDSDWITVDPWESKLPGFCNFPAVCRRLNSIVKTAFPEENIRVMYVCGTDMVRDCGLAHWGLCGGTVGVIGVDRGGHEVTSYNPDYVYIVKNEDKDAKHISSTSIRKRIWRNQYFDDLTPTKVQNYILDNEFMGACRTTFENAEEKRKQLREDKLKEQNKD